MGFWIYVFFSFWAVNLNFDLGGVIRLLFTRFKCIVQVDVINMSYGEHSHWSHTGRLGQLMAEVTKFTIHFSIHFTIN